MSMLPLTSGIGNPNTLQFLSPSPGFALPNQSTGLLGLGNNPLTGLPNPAGMPSLFPGPTGIGATTTNLFNPSLLNPTPLTGLSSGTLGSNAGLSQILTLLLQLLTTLGPALALSTATPMATPTPDPELAKLKEENETLKEKNNELEDELDDARENNKPQKNDNPNKPDDGNNDPSMSLADRAKALDKNVFDTIWNYAYGIGSDNSALIQANSNSGPAQKVDKDLFNFIFQDGWRKGRISVGRSPD